jgi:hypothetical protein
MVEEYICSFEFTLTLAQITPHHYVQHLSLLILGRYSLGRLFQQRTIIMNQSIDAQQAVFGTLELLTGILRFLPQADLLRLGRVCSLWRTLIATTPTLQRTIFDPNAATSEIAEARVGTPRILNKFVVDRLRWSPTLDLTQVNSQDFTSVRQSITPNLRAMAAKEASWRGQLLTWPPLTDLLVLRGTIEQDEEHLQSLRLLCRSGSLQSGREGACSASADNVQDTNDGAEDNNDGEPEEDDKDADDEEEGDEQTLPLVLYVEDFPHNADKACPGIRVIDLLYGLRVHYKENQYCLESYELIDFSGPGAGKIIVYYSETGITPQLDVTILTF